MNTIQVTEEECKVFPGGWSYPPGQMYRALGAVKYGARLKLLEFGAGAGTEALASLLQSKQVPFLYVSYENNPEYLSTREDVKAVYWKETPEHLYPERYDLILMDGPRGSKTNTRMRWFPLLRPVVKKGTILVIDDFGHNPGYRSNLDQHFSYFTVAEKDPDAETGESWIVVEIEKVR